MVIRFFGVAIFVTFLLNVHCIQAEPKLWVEKNPVTAGESFRMFVEVENEDDPEGTKSFINQESQSFEPECPESNFDCRDPYQQESQLDI